VFYTTCCIDSTAELIDAMTESSTKIDFPEFTQEAEDLIDIERGMGYGPHLRIENDFHVKFHRGTFDGKPCVYMVHSCVEHIWT